MEIVKELHLDYSILCSILTRTLSLDFKRRRPSIAKKEA